MGRWPGARVVGLWLGAAKERARRIRDFLWEGAYGSDLPPARLRDVGPGDFVATGREFLGHFVGLGALQPWESVLEIGCGSGRMALPLAGYLSAEGQYVGIDVVAGAVAWCQRHVSSRHRNFTFHHIDVFNQRYNPGGRMRASSYGFPCPDRSFDFVFLTSVFTHMYPPDVAHYLREIARLLRPTGRLFATCFLVNATQRTLAEQGRNQIDFRYDRGVYRIRDEKVPESAVALDEQAVRAMFEEAGLRVREPIRFGTWSGRSDGPSFQDIIVADPISRISPLQP